MTIVRAISRIIFFCRRYHQSWMCLRIAACAVLTAAFYSPHIAGATIVQIESNLGGFNVELYDTQAPLTVANFLNYVNRGDYNNTVIHRSAVSGTPPVPFVIQGGGYRCCLFGTLYHFPTDPPVLNEFDPSRSNVRGTIAMAKSADPNSATSEWFINLGDNSAALDDINNSGGFTVFGRVLDPGMNVVDAIASLPIVPIPGFPELPGINGNFVTVTQICINNDGDGACSETEDLAPGGDGNGDGIPDRDQANVTTIQTLFGATVTFAAEPMMRLDPVNAVSVSTVTSLLKMFKSPPDQSVYFNNGMYTFSMTGVIDTAGSIVTMYDRASARPTHYYAFGPTPDNPMPHWYDFAFDGETGAEIMSDRIILHFVDGKRGDNDLTANNSITHTGAQAVVTENANSSSQAGGGCSIVAPPSPNWRGGDWIVVSLFLALLALIRRRTRNSRIQRAPRQRNSE
ncbi:peptidylprolyl isomerase [Sulfuricaulis sp.]|uniref:peptidylprolyl isomerase n=1 Tax=Sulfuricaulis sp. TaxID=2003553 RepID=UPI00355A1C81